MSLCARPWQDWKILPCGTWWDPVSIFLRSLSYTNETSWHYFSELHSFRFREQMTALISNPPACFYIKTRSLPYHCHCQNLQPYLLWFCTLHEQIWITKWFREFKDDKTMQSLRSRCIQEENAWILGCLWKWIITVFIGLFQDPFLFMWFMNS